MTGDYNPKGLVGNICSIEDCKEIGVRSLPAKKVKSALPYLKISDDMTRRVQLCKKHYQEYKKIFNIKKVFGGRKEAMIFMPMKHKPRGVKGDICCVEDCNENGVKSLSTKKVKSAVPNLKLKADVGKRAQLCKKHYKEFKKKTKKERELERLGWD
jgi:hypothetical protein